MRLEADWLGASHLRLVDIDRQQLRAAAQLRAVHGIRTPDALQLSAGLAARATTLVTNDRRLPRKKLRRLLHEAARDAGREVTRMKDLPRPLDFPEPVGREGREKSVLVTLA